MLAPQPDCSPSTPNWQSRLGHRTCISKAGLPKSRAVSEINDGWYGRNLEALSGLLSILGIELVPGCSRRRGLSAVPLSLWPMQNMRISRARTFLKESECSKERDAMEERALTTVAATATVWWPWSKRPTECGEMTSPVGRCSICGPSPVRPPRSRGWPA